MMHPHSRAVSAAFLAGTAALALLVPLAGASAGEADDSFRAALKQHDIGATDPEHAGIWKVATPPEGVMHGEFGGNDPLGLAAGVRIPADCSINWIDPDSGKRYCFSSATSLVMFLDTPHAYLARALRNWRGS